MVVVFIICLVIGLISLMFYDGRCWLFLLSSWLLLLMLYYMVLLIDVVSCMVFGMW